MPASMNMPVGIKDVTLTQTTLSLCIRRGFSLHPQILDGRSESADSHDTVKDNDEQRCLNRTHVVWQGYVNLGSGMWHIQFRSSNRRYTRRERNKTDTSFVDTTLWPTVMNG